jgi:hypothetical protein
MYHIYALVRKENGLTRTRGPFRSVFIRRAGKRHYFVDKYPAPR